MSLKKLPSSTVRVVGLGNTASFLFSSSDSVGLINIKNPIIIKTITVIDIRATLILCQMFFLFI